jgi:hypothetical protein
VCRSHGTCDSVLPDGAVCENSLDCPTLSGCDVHGKFCVPPPDGGT